VPAGPRHLEWRRAGEWGDAALLESAAALWTVVYHPARPAPVTAAHSSRCQSSVWLRIPSAH